MFGVIGAIERQILGAGYAKAEDVEGEQLSNAIARSDEKVKSEYAVSRAAYAGLYRTNPKLTFVMTLAMFSLAGIPPFAGFFSKFFVFASAFNTGHWLVVFLALVNTVISLFYYLLVVKAMYITPNDSPLPYFQRQSAAILPQPASHPCHIGDMPCGNSAARNNKQCLWRNRGSGRNVNIRSLIDKIL